jgi:hypothetical protein
MSALTRLIDQFVAAQQSHRENAWRMADLAADIQRVAGRRGSSHCPPPATSASPTYDVSSGPPGAFPPAPATRASVSTTTSRPPKSPAASMGRGPSTPHTSGSAKPASKGITAVALEQAARRHVPRASSLADRQALAAQRVAAAERARHHLLTRLQEFNAVHAVFWGATLVLSEQPILAPAS